MTVFETIEAQQKGQEETPVFMVGEQLKDICRSDPHCAELVAADLENKDMSLEACERKKKAYADEQHRKQKGSCVCMPPDVAEGIIREFYGLPKAGALPAATEQEPVEESGGFLNLDDFL